MSNNKFVIEKGKLIYRQPVNLNEAIPPVSGTQNSSSFQQNNSGNNNNNNKNKNSDGDEPTAPKADFDAAINSFIHIGNKIKKGELFIDPKDYDKVVKIHDSLNKLQKINTKKSGQFGGEYGENSDREIGKNVDTRS